MPDIACEPFVPHAFDELVKSGALLPEVSREFYERKVAAFSRLEGTQVLRIRYLSGPFTVTGMLVAPAHIEPLGHPLIIYNRGGNREFGRLTALTALRTLVPLSRQNNALVFASNYRGVDGGEGRDELGGADVEDVLALLALARAHAGWDGRRSMMAGGSRGSMMTFMALKNGAEVNCAVSVAGMSDMAASERERPSMTTEVFAQCIPDFAARKQEHYQRRSAVLWPEALRVPVLLLHGDADMRVNVMQSIRLAQALAKHNVPHELVVYKGDDHNLTRNWDDALTRMGEWMRRA